MYNAAKGYAVYDAAGITSITLSQNFTISLDFSGDFIETFIDFILQDGKEVSNSVYIGSVAVGGIG